MNSALPPNDEAVAEGREAPRSLTARLCWRCVRDPHRGMPSTP